MHCDLDLWPFDLKIYRAHPSLMGSLHVKFHDDRCKGKAVMRRKPFSVICALWPWPLAFWPKNLWAHPWLMGSLHVKFMMIGVKGKQLCTGNPNADDRRTDGRTDRHGDSSIPPLTSLRWYNDRALILCPKTTLICAPWCLKVSITILLSEICPWWGCVVGLDRGLSDLQSSPHTPPPQWASYHRTTVWICRIVLLESRGIIYTHNTRRAQNMSLSSLDDEELRRSEIFILLWWSFLS